MHPIGSPKRVPLNRCEKFDIDQDGSGQKSEVSVWTRKSILCAELSKNESAVVEPNSVKKQSAWLAIRMYCVKELVLYTADRFVK